jgi:HEAT repeat protein
MSAAILLSLHAHAQPAPTTSPVTAAAALNVVIASQSALLNGGSTVTDQQREQAAERLLSLNRPDAKAALLRTLQAPDSPTAAATQAAIALAIANSAKPDAQFVPALQRLLATNPEAAADALASYAATPSSDDVLTQLINTAKDYRLGSGTRGAVLRAMGSFSQKQAADFLMSMIENPNELEGVRDAAADAMTHLTGQAFGNNAAQWNTWWAANGNVPNNQWQQTVTAARAQDESSLRRDLNRLRESTKALLSAEHDRLNADQEQQLQLLLEWLRNEDPTIRYEAAYIVSNRKLNARRIDDHIIEQLRLMISDSSVEVRKQVVIDLKLIVDSEAVGPLIAQLAVETDPDVKRNIVITLGQLAQPAAVRPLLDALDDPNLRVAEAAADALGSLGAQIQASPELRALVSDKLRAKLGQIGEQPGTDDLRAAIFDAEAPLQDPEMYQTFAAAALNAERNTPPVRIAAVRGLHSLADSPARDSAAATLKNVMHNDTDGSVRLEAVKAVSDLGTLAVDGDALYERMRPDTEPDSSVRNASWSALLNLCGRADVTPDAIQRGWIEHELIRSDPAKRLALEKILRDKLTAQGGNDPKTLEQLANVQQDIGGLCRDMGQWSEAIANYRSALEYWLNHPGPETTRAEISGQLVNALLKSGNYPEAVRFANQRITADDQEQHDMGQAIRDEVQRLQKTGDVNNAKQLADLALDSKQLQLNSFYVDQIRQIRLDLDKQKPNPDSGNNQ